MAVTWFYLFFSDDDEMDNGGTFGPWDLGTVKPNFLEKVPQYENQPITNGVEKVRSWWN